MDTSGAAQDNQKVDKWDIIGTNLFQASHSEADLFIYQARESSLVNKQVALKPEMFLLISCNLLTSWLLTQGTYGKHTVCGPVG